MPDTKRNEIICNILLRDEKVHFNDLLRKVAFDYKPITSRVLSKTLDRMEHEHIVHRDDYTENRGRKRNIWLTDNAKEQIKLGIFEGLEYQRNAEREHNGIKARKIRRAIALLLILSGSGINRLETVSKAEPGDVLVMNKKTGKSMTCRSNRIRDLSLDDIIEGRMHDPVGEIVQDLPKDVLEKSMRILQQEDFPVIIPAPSRKGRYEIHPKFEGLRDFLITSKNVLSLIVWLIRRRWMLSRRITSAHTQAYWYSSLFGSSNVASFFSDIDKIREYENRLLKPFFENILKEHNRPINGQNLKRLFEKQVKIEIKSVVRHLELELQEFNTNFQKAKVIHFQFCQLVNDLVQPNFLPYIIKQGKGNP